MANIVTHEHVGFEQDKEALTLGIRDLKMKLNELDVNKIPQFTVQYLTSEVYKLIGALDFSKERAES